MRLARWLLAASIGLSCASPPRALVQEQRPVVVGVGNRLSGRADVTWLGDPAHPFAAAVEGVARAAAARGLSVTCTRRQHLGAGVPSSAVVATVWPPADADVEPLREYRRAGKGLVVLVDADLASDARPLGVTRSPLTGSIALHAIDPTAPTSWTDVPDVLAWPDESGAIHVVAAGRTADPASVALSVLRHAIVRADGVTYLPTAFGDVSAEERGGTLVVNAPALLAGTVTMDVVTTDGVSVLPPGPLRPVDLSKVPDAERAVLRLRFAGDGVADETRLWLPDLLPMTFARARLTGFARAWSGEPALFRVAVDAPDGTNVEGCAVDAALGDVSISATTDASGAAVLAFTRRRRASRGRRPSPRRFAAGSWRARSRPRST